MSLIFFLLHFHSAYIAQQPLDIHKRIEKNHENVFNQEKSNFKIFQNENNKCGPNLFYSFQSNSLVITGEGEMFDYEFNINSYSEPNSTTPWDSNKKSITEVSISIETTNIGSYAFYYFSSLKTINIPENIKSIGSYSFSGCSNLISISSPNNVEKIGSSTFSYCTKLTNIQFSSSLTSVGHGLFKNCTQLQNIEMPNEIDILTTSMFYGCKKLNITELPKKITSIEASTFYDCLSLHLL